MNPKKNIPISDLCDFINPPKKHLAMMGKDDLKDSLNAEDMSISDMQDDGLDHKGKKVLLNRIKELKEIINEPESLEGEINQANAELKQIQKSMLNVYGINALHHKAPKKVNESIKKDLDRARIAIKRTYKIIEQKNPNLAKYLNDNIKQGKQYCFTDTRISWHIFM